MRLLATLAAAALWAGCILAGSEASLDHAPGDDDTRGADACTVDADCVLAGPSCCDCPTYAVAGASGWADACEQVDCPMPAACPALEPRCLQNTCVAACAPAPCDLSCAEGFAIDAAGCTECACAGGATNPQCQLDSDCVQVAADCCGCARGGTDTAVPVGEASGFVDGLGCSGNEACPGVSTCVPGATAMCLAGRCTLAGGAAPPPDGECGRPELPPCPSGQVCVINSGSGEAGSGRCEAP